ncbi:helix-turn-helix transcriptional regulator [Leucobacter sp. UCMA 4100]|uniref:helix-turn-helix domain-containing protein n=1 Tax=Leucobacter sp. UCMA 4100 TaxID=2810534 RepID=UPI0022EA23B5|nr:helix-turn-helix transcriptional regulator [Leucobacter sp. UCMA 4100]MDA3147364.1 helix-turn-helix transcriptional regulator [Leucobacter sp. UCMA 4100]
MQQSEHLRIARIVGNKIRSRRRAIGISQQDLADMAEIHLTSLSRIERGITTPKVDMLARLATALDTTTADLVSGITDSDVHPKERRRITANDLMHARKTGETAPPQ